MAPRIMLLSCCRAMPKNDGAKKPAPEMVPDQRWKLQVCYLCFYGFMTQIRPGESFITPYLLGTDKNFTKTEVSCGHLVPHPGVPLYGHGHLPRAVQSIPQCFWGAQGCHVLGMAACGDSWWCFLGREGGVLWGLVSLGCEVTLSPEPHTQLALA